jgi:hypothetical protein
MDIRSFFGGSGSGAGSAKARSAGLAATGASADKASEGDRGLSNGGSRSSNPSGRHASPTRKPQAQASTHPSAVETMDKRPRYLYLHLGLGTLILRYVAHVEMSISTFSKIVTTKIFRRKSAPKGS